MSRLTEKVEELMVMNIFQTMPTSLSSLFLNMVINLPGDQVSWLMLKVFDLLRNSLGIISYCPLLFIHAPMFIFILPS